MTGEEEKGQRERCSDKAKEGKHRPNFRCESLDVQQELSLKRQYV